MTRHKLTEEESKKGSQASILSRRYIAKVQKQIAKLGIEKEWTGKILEVLKVFAATPMGQLTIAFLLLNLIESVGLMKGEDTGHIKGAGLAAVVAGALASSGLLAQAGSLASTLITKGAEVAE